MSSNLTPSASANENIAPVTAIPNLFLGEASADQVRTAAALASPEDVVAKHCQASWFIAEYELLRGNPARKSELQQAISMCPKDYFEFRVATTELARLK